MRVLEVDVGALNRGLEKAIAGARYPLHPVATVSSFRRLSEKALCFLCMLADFI
jgi:hypothetical protein